MSALQSDAFVFFGATGDLAYKKIFPALYDMVHRGTLQIPIIGMARAGWSLEKLRERARASLEHAGDFEPECFAKLHTCSRSAASNHKCCDRDVPVEYDLIFHCHNHRLSDGGNNGVGRIADRRDVRRQRKRNRDARGNSDRRRSL